MTLGFSLFFDKKKEVPTYFPQKVLKGLLLADKISTIEYNRLSNNFRERLPNYQNHPLFAAKKHSVRNDENGRWVVGSKVHLSIGVRQSWFYQFSPTLECTGIQSVEMRHTDHSFIVTIDGRALNEEETMIFAVNDGFDSLFQFYKWFRPLAFANDDNCYRGRLIHWTDFRY